MAATSTNPTENPPLKPATGYQRCVRCVMDTTDPTIRFDDAGVCSHCHEFDAHWVKRWWPNDAGRAKLDAIFAGVRERGKGKPYDCIIGLSGGLDSAYLALKLKEFNLRPLAVHVDCGWNSELAVHNIQQIVERCGYDLITIVVDWEEVKDLQLAFLKSGVANQDAVQDHAFFAGLYHCAVEHDIHTVISGGNIATEAIFPKTWHGNAMDLRNLTAIHNKFGKIKLKNYPQINLFQYYFYYPFIQKMRVVRPLNYLPYNRAAALAELKEKVGYKEYGRKHGESVFTKFFQNYYLPTRWNMDKRLPHLSSMILSGQITRDQAMAELAQPLYSNEELTRDVDYFCKKLSLTEAEFRALLEVPKHEATDYPNQEAAYKLLKRVQGFLAKLSGKKVMLYG